MNINNPGSQLTASAVWTSATRTLTADPATTAGAATLVWNKPSGRQLTSFYNNLPNTNASKTSIAAAATVDLRPPSGSTRDGIVIVDNVLVFMAGWDGTNEMNTQTTSTVFFLSFLKTTIPCGIRLRNTDAAAHNYMYSVADWNNQNI